MNATDTHALIAAAKAKAPRALSASLPLRVVRWGGWIAAVAALVWMCGDLGLAPAKLGSDLAQLGRTFVAMWPPDSADREPQIIAALTETLAMALVGTVLAAALALPLSLLAAKTVTPQPLVHFLVRRVLDVARAIPTLVWALILVTALGLGVLAIVLAEAPMIAKVFAEMIENRKPGPIESLRASGANALQVLRYGLAPQVLPIIAGMSVFLFEVNLRASAVLGVVGAGGIGAEMEDRIRLLLLDQVCYILLLYAFVVIILDLGSQYLRRRLVEG